MPFDQNNLPEWNAPGVEPPQSKKDSGWGVEEKPPGEWFNWFFNKTFKALQSLFSSAQHKEEKGQPNGYASLDGHGKVPSSQLNLSKDQVGLGNVDNVKQATKTDFDSHANDTVRHVTQADKDKWNGALPASSYTANDVLNKIKTVDGSGSGLDADTVDGKHFSDIQADAQEKANQAEANAINFAKGFGLGSYAKDIGNADLNTLSGSGFYQCSNSATNTPVAGFGFLIIHVEATTLTAYQTAYMVSVNNRMFFRRKSSGGWEPWREIAVQGQAFYDAAHVNFADSIADGVYYRAIEHGSSGDFEIRAYNAADNTLLKTLFRVSKDGVVSLLYQSHVDVSRSTALAVASATDVKISFQTESKDSVNEFASDKFTPLATGVYLFTGYFNFATTPAGHIYLKIYKNGSPWQTFPCGHNDRLTTFARSIYIPQPGSDYFEFYVHQSSGASVNLDNMAMQITKLA